MDQYKTRKITSRAEKLIQEWQCMRLPFMHEQLQNHIQDRLMQMRFMQDLICIEHGGNVETCCDRLITACVVRSGFDSSRQVGAS